MAILEHLTPDELLTTTRAVRKRLDLTRPVEREVIEECLAIAQQAPTASNLQNWHFVVVTNPSKRAALAALYRKSWGIYLTLLSATPNLTFDDSIRNAAQTRIYASAQYLVDHLHEVPVHVIPCILGRTEGQSIITQSAQWGTIAPAAWSFMLAARARGLGTCWTSFHLLFEEEAAKIVGIPYAEIMQACLIPVAYTEGTEFKPGPREPLQSMVHWETWCG
jgi:nitroreductase